MNIKTPDYKAQAENLRATLLNYIDCMQKIQDINEKLRKENEDLKKKAELYKLYKSFIDERDKKILNQKMTIENLFKERDELKKSKEDVTLEYVEALQHSWDLAVENFQLKKKIEELKDRIHKLETILNIYEGRKHD